ncbi:MAG TPA: hypothetical protein VGI19_09805 [Candidatus Cybelea sp.]|jgi:hypothetical protein
MAVTVKIKVGETPVAFDLDFESQRWSAPRELPEGYFPLVTDVDEKRYELYYGGTFAEVEQ